jgi:CRP-like cAMP-binding protein
METAELVSLARQETLYRSQAPIEHVFFLEEGVASIVHMTKDGHALETCLCGPDGMVGLPLFLGAESAVSAAFQVVAGSAWRMDAYSFAAELERSPELRAALGLYTQVTMTTMAQTAVCTRRHTIEQRCVSWLLQMNDYSEGPFQLTHEFMSQMLGVRRATVTQIASSLQQAGLIAYHRGTLRIVDRPAMLKMVCECYDLCRQERERLIGVPAGRDQEERESGWAQAK